MILFESGRGAFCSELIAKVFAVHLKKIESAPSGYSSHGLQIGGLTLAAAAVCASNLLSNQLTHIIQVERGLTIFEIGEDGLRTGRANARSYAFTENPWGLKACALTSSTKRLTDNHWAVVLEHAYPFVNCNSTEPGSDGQNSEGDDLSSGVQNPRALIDLDWCAY